MDSIWRAELESMTPDEAALGWKACRSSGDSHPVTLPQFVQRVSEALRAAKPVEVHRRLAEPKSVRMERAETAERHLADVREKLGVKSPKRSGGASTGGA